MTAISLRLAPLIAVALMLIAAGCSLESGSQDANQDSGSQNANQVSSSQDADSDNAGDSGDDASGSGQASATGPQWSDYIPARNGRVCTYSSSLHTEDAVGIDSATVNATQTSEYTNVHEESDGTHFTVESTTETTTIMEFEDGETERIPLPPETETLEYVLVDDGTLRSEPALFSREGFDTGVEMSVDEFIVYPAIDALRQGQSHSSSITATGRATDPEAQAELEEGLEPGESAVKMRVDYTVEGVPPKEITTPAGTFTDTVGVALKFDDIEALNANAETRRDMDQMAQLLTELAGTTTVWYARDVGIVQTETGGGMAAAMVEGKTTAEGGTAPAVPPIKLQGCTGEASSEPTTEASEPTSPEPTTEPETTTLSESQNPRTVSSGGNSGDSDTGGDTGSSDDSEEASLRQAVGDYYRAAGAEEWAYTYDHLDSRTQSMFTEEEWSRKNQWFWDSNPTVYHVYHILSIDLDSTSPEPLAEVEVRITGEDGSSWTRTAYFVQEDGEWKHRLSEAETDLFMPDATFEEFVEAQADTSS